MTNKSKKDAVRSISPAEFFSMNRTIAGFSNPAKALYTTIRELVENALDACESINVFPDIRIRIRKLTVKELKEIGVIDIHYYHQGEDKNQAGSEEGEKRATEKGSLSEDESGTMTSLESRNSVVEERNREEKERSRKKRRKKEEGDQIKPPEVFEIIISDNGKGMPHDKIPVLLGKVLTSTKYKIKQHRGRFGLGLKMAIIYSLQELNSPVEVWSATRAQTFVSYYKLKIDIIKNEPIILDSKKIQKAKYQDPWGRKLYHGTVIRLLILGDWTRAKPYVLEYLKQLAIITPYATFLFEGPNGEKVYYERVSDKIPEPPKEAKYHLSGIDAQTLIKLMRENKRLTMLEFLMKTFERVGKRTAEKFLSELNIDPNTPVREVLKDDRLITAFVRKAAIFKFTRPDASALSPIGKKLLEAGLRAILKPEFVYAYQRKPISLQGHPLIVEVGIAYGGEITPGLKLLRFANRVPLLHKEKSDVAWKALEEINLSRYKVSDQDPVVLAVSIVSTKIPFPTTSKDYIDNVDILRNEIKLAFMKVLRRLKLYKSRLEKLKLLEEKRRVLIKYVRRFAMSVSKILLSDEKYKDTLTARDDVLYAYLIDNIDHKLLQGRVPLDMPLNNPHNEAPNKATRPVEEEQ